MKQMEQVSPDKKKALVITGKIDYILEHYIDEDGGLKKSELTREATLKEQLEKIKNDLEQIG